MQTPHNHPLRVYSTLLEYNDATALKMYNKLHNLVSSKKGSKKEMKGDQKEKEIEEEDIMTYLQTEEEGVSG